LPAVVPCATAASGVTDIDIEPKRAMAAKATSRFVKGTLIKLAPECVGGRWDARKGS
jgi:hypothetical protein